MYEPCVQRCSNSLINDKVNIDLQSSLAVKAFPGQKCRFQILELKYEEEDCKFKPLMACEQKNHVLSPNFSCSQTILSDISHIIIGFDD